MTDRIPSVGGEGYNTWQAHHASSNRVAWWRDDAEWREYVESFDDKDVRFALDEAAAILERRRAIPNSAADFDPDIEHPVHLGKATPEETIRVNTGKANVRDATPNRVTADAAADTARWNEVREVAAELIRQGNHDPAEVIENAMKDGVDIAAHIIKGTLPDGW